MRLIPPYVARFNDGPNGSESRVHSLLGDLSVDGFALHSFNIPRHGTKKEGELDFLLILEWGLVGLEVKGGGLVRQGGQWALMLNHGRARHLSESPFIQAKDGIHAVLDAIRSRQEFDRGFNIAYGVVTPQGHPLPAQIEVDPAMHASAIDCASHEAFGSWLDRLTAYWTERKEQGGRRAFPAITRQDRQRLLRLLRPNFEATIPLGVRLADYDQKLMGFTEDQYQYLDLLAANARVLCRGGAGTGKTFLAMEALRRDAAGGRSVLFLARSRPLIEFVRSGDVPTSATFATWDQVRNGLVDGPFDSLVVDEGQDLLELDVLQAVFGLLEGGLEDGRWCWFMDDNLQAGFYGAADDEAVAILEGRGVTTLPLRVNCRNAKNVVVFTNSITGASIGEPRQNEDSILCESIALPRHDLVSSVHSRVRKWVNEDQIQADQIAVLTPTAGLHAQLRNRLPYGVKVETIANFKGLEAQVVAVLDLDDGRPLREQLHLLYTGVTRARHAVWLAVAPESARELDQMMQDNMRANQLKGADHG